jgi:hypothetical protein
MFTNDIGYAIQNRQRISVKASSDAFHDIIITNTYVQVDGTQTTLTNTSEFTIDTPLYLFASQDDLSRKFRGSIAKFQIFDEDDNILLNYIPVVRVEDDAVGMYDTVTNTFFTNAGTGTFSYE